MSGGAFVISFDFEMAWGLRRSAPPGGEVAGVERVREVVDGLLEIFRRHTISATWATIGHLMVRRQDCVDGRFAFDWPAPRYPWFSGGWFDHIPRIDEPGADRFYAPDLIEKLVACPVYQELGAHTFSHVMVGHPACSAEIARAEFDACRRLAQRWGRALRSVVFPWNRAGHLDVLEDLGFTCYRAMNAEWYWFGAAEKIGTPLGQPLGRRLARRLTLPLRWADERLRLTPPLPAARRVGRLWELPHSMFFSGFGGVGRFVSPADRVAKALKGLQVAARRGRIFSLYTHPENFLPTPGPLLDAFDRICAAAARARDAGDIRVLTMESAAAELEAGAAPPGWCSP